MQACVIKYSHLDRFIASTLKLRSRKKSEKYVHLGVSIVAQWFTNPTSIHEDAGLIPGLVQCVKDPVWPGAVV